MTAPSALTIAHGNRPGAPCPSSSAPRASPRPAA